MLCWQAMFIPFVGIVGNMYNRVWLIAAGVQPLVADLTLPYSHCPLPNKATLHCLCRSDGCL